jgi:hypothetical protein
MLIGTDADSSEPPKISRDKYKPFSSIYMPPALAVWSSAVMRITQDSKRKKRTAYDGCYFFPEPASIISSPSTEKICALFMAWI